VTDELIKNSTEKDSDPLRSVVEKDRWPNKTHRECPECRSKRVSVLASRNQYHCDECRYQFSVKVGTWLQGSHLKYQDWYTAVYICCEKSAEGKDLKSGELKRALKVSYKSARQLVGKIEKMLAGMENEDWRNFSTEKERNARRKELEFFGRFRATSKSIAKTSVQTLELAESALIKETNFAKAGHASKESPGVQSTYDYDPIPAVDSFKGGLAWFKSG
jgi:transposase-like protein